MSDNAGMRYESDLRFAGYYFEDSYVLSIDESNQQVSFSLECVLTPVHPRYVAPPPTMQHCYRNVRLTFADIEFKDWRSRSERQYSDANGEKDLGNIDTFILFPNNRYRITGDWGDLEVIARRVEVIVD